MANNIIPQSIFDSIRRTNEQDNEYWTARELMPLLGYRKWERFVDSIDRAKFSCKNADESVSDHFADAGVYTRGVPSDYKLSRFACYLIAMNGDPRKVEIAQAQTYFVIKTREAETVIPAQNETLKLAEMEIEKLKIQLAIATQQNQANQAALESKKVDNAMLTMHGAPVVLALRGMSNQVVEQEKRTTEVIDEKTGARFYGMTATQLKDLIAQKYGIKYKSGAEIIRYLESQDMGHLVAQTPRRVLSDYIPDEFVDEAVKVLTTGNRQMLLGE